MRKVVRKVMRVPMLLPMDVRMGMGGAVGMRVLVHMALALDMNLVAAATASDAHDFISFRGDRAFTQSRFR
jgi:hypothetical protein